MSHRRTDTLPSPAKRHFSAEMSKTNPAPCLVMLTTVLPSAEAVATGSV